MDDTVSKILSHIDTHNLLVVPKILLDFMDAIQQDDVEVETIEKIIGQDGGLSSKILEAANSPFYRQWGEVKDLKHVMVVLGLSTVKTLVMSAAIQQFFAKIPLNHQHFLELIWYRSFTAAHIAQHLARLTDYPFPDEAYLTGLIHRLGQLILLAFFPNDYPEFLTWHFDEQDENVERQRFDVTHAEVAAQFIASWNIRSFMADAVRYQRQPVEAITESARLVKIIHLACRLSSVSAENKHRIFAESDDLFGLNQALTESILQEAKVLVEKSAGCLGIKIISSDDNAIQNLTQNDRRKTNHELLGNHIKKLALTAVVQKSIPAPSELTKLITVIQRNLSIIFGFQGVVVFLYHSKSDSLEWVSGESQQNDVWSTISINSASNSLLAKTLSRKRILYSFNKDKTTIDTIVDQQICRLLNVDGMLTIPMLYEDQVLGVIATGLQFTDVEKIKSNLYFITLFVKEATLSIQALQAFQEANAHKISTLHTDYQLQAKKVAHEVNNPLSIINNYLHLLEIKVGESIADEVRIIQEEIHRVGNILLRLPDVSDDSPNRTDLVDIKALITDLIKLFEASGLNSRQIKVNLAFEDSSIKIATDRDKLKQILTNLLKNALEAMPSGGTIDVSTRDKVLHQGKYYIEIQISDNGPGIPNTVKQQLFQPVTSTKGKHHSGLGLTISKNLVAELKGFIDCHSSDMGTQFKILLPMLNVGVTV